jgi:hypothetical protein
LKVENTIRSNYTKLQKEEGVKQIGKILMLVLIKENDKKLSKAIFDFLRVVRACFYPREFYPQFIKIFSG